MNQPFDNKTFENQMFENQTFEYEPGQEPERYELREPPRYHFTPDRRDFCKLLGGGIVVLLLVDSEADAQFGRGRGRGGFGGGRPQDIGAWLHIDEAGKITVYTGKAEVGQNIRTSLSQIVAEELRVSLDSVRMVMSDTELVPYDAGTFGSRTTPDMSQQLQRVAAAAREALVEMAAEVWKVDRSALAAADGKIVNSGTKESLEFGKLTEGKKITKTVSGDVRTTPAERWQVAGHSHVKVNGREFVTGAHKYASDVKLPGMLHARVLRPKAFGASLVSIDTKAAEAMPGVIVVRDGDFVGVAAPTQQEAESALLALRAKWETRPQISSDELFEALKRPTGGGRGGFGGRGGRGGRGGFGRGGGGTVGSIEDGLAAADVKLDATYTIAYIAHAPLEPRAAVAEWKDGKLTVWTGTQRPFGIRGELAGAFRLSDADVHVIVPDTGSGYGGKHSGEAAVEAARIARTAGKPVKLVWTREEEFTWAYFRPAGVIDVKSGARKDGTLTAWEFHNYNSGGSAIRTLYEVPNQRTESHPSNSPLRQGSYRALAATANHFARECHMDELAHALGMDPLAFRLKNIKDERLRAVLEAVADAFGWGKTKPPEGRGYGIAGGSEKNSYVATCAEVEVDRASGRVRVIRATTAFECGAIVNPDQLKNQVEGAMVMGLGGALLEAIEFADGRITNAAFSGYRVPRFRDTPRLEVVLLDRKDAPSSGAGETPIVGIAPAIGNAIFAATGQRLRSMPLRGLKT